MKPFPRCITLTSKTTLTAAPRVGELRSIVVNSKRKMNVGNIRGIITLIFTLSAGDYFRRHAVIYSWCLKVGKINVMQQTAVNKSYFMCVFYCADGLQLLKEAVSLWGGFDVGTELEKLYSTITQRTVKYGCVGKSTFLTALNRGAASQRERDNFI